MLCEHAAEPTFGQTEPVVRSGVEVADAGLPRGLHARSRYVLVHRLEQVADGRAAKAKLGDLDRCGAEPARLRPHRSRAASAALWSPEAMARSSARAPSRRSVAAAPTYASRNLLDSARSPNIASSSMNAPGWTASRRAAAITVSRRRSRTSIGCPCSSTPIA